MISVTAKEVFPLNFSLPAVPLSYRNYRQKLNLTQLSYGSYGSYGHVGKCVSIKIYENRRYHKHDSWEWKLGVAAG